MIDEQYILKEPKTQTTSMVFNSPHSGRCYLESFLKNSILDKTEIRASEDAYIDDLFSSSTDFGAPLLSAVAPRAYVDLNRHANELDSAIIQGVEIFSDKMFLPVPCPFSICGCERLPVDRM